jgi:hypothetical protein
VITIKKTNKTRLTDALVEIHRITDPVWNDKGDATEFRALPKRDRYIAWAAYEAIFYAGLWKGESVEDAIEEAAAELTNSGFYCPDRLAAYAYREAKAGYYKSLRKDETEEVISGYEECLKILA